MLHRSLKSFSIKTLLFATMLCALGLWGYRELHSRQNALDQLRVAGAGVYWFGQLPGRSDPPFRKENAPPRWAIDLLGEACFFDVSLLYFGRLEADAEDLFRLLSEFPEVTVIEFNFTKCTDDHVRLISKLPNLRVLWLDATLVTDASLKYLVHSPKLQSVSINETAISDQAIEEFKARRPDVGVVSGGPAFDG